MVFNYTKEAGWRRHKMEISSEKWKLHIEIIVTDIRFHEDKLLLRLRKIEDNKQHLPQ